MKTNLLLIRNIVIKILIFIVLIITFKRLPLCSQGIKLQRFIYMSDDFCKEFVLQQEKYMVKDKYFKYRNKPNRMSNAEIMAILTLFYSGVFRCFKHYYKACKQPAISFLARTFYTFGFLTSNICSLKTKCDDFPWSLHVECSLKP